MKSARFLSLFPIAIIAVLLGFASPVYAQLIAYDDAGNYLVSANWTNGANQGFGFLPWVITTNGPDNHGTYIASGNSPTFAIASVTNVLGTNYTDVFGIYANGPTDINETAAYRGFANPLGTNTFKLQWGSRGAGVTTTTNFGAVHGWCGFTLRNGNATNSTGDFQTGTRLYFYFLDGASPSTLYVWDANGVQSVPGTSFSDLGRANITNAIEAEVTVGTDGNSYHLVVKDCVVNRTIYTLDSILQGSGTIDSVALFCHETTGDQVYNRMQITASTNIPPTVVNVQPANGSIYLDPNATSLAFEVDSFNSRVTSSSVSVYLNGVLQSGSTFNTAAPTSQLLATNNPTLSPNTFYTYTVVAQDANGNVVSNNYTFNTFSSTNNPFIDAMDYNYGAGQFMPGPGPAQYGGLLGTNGIDYLDVTTLTNLNDYRPDYTPGDAPLPQLIVIAPDPTGDPVDHEGFIANNITDYQLAYTDAGDWDNYTRSFPATNYTVYARAASGGGGSFQVDILANSTATTSNQPVAVLGTCNVQPTGGSTVYSGQLTPLIDLFGNPVVLHLSGTTTLRQTATQARTYNLSYLTFVPNAGATLLGPYISVGSPAPNATGVLLTTPITFSIANRQTTVNPATIQMFLNATNVTSRLVSSNNAAGTTVTWTPTNNLPSNYTNTVTVIFTDSGSVSVTNSWDFITGTSGGSLGSGLWSGGGGPSDMFWADAVNWTGGTPGPGFNAAFASPGATTTLVTNNIVATNVTILGLFYETNTSGYHTTWIQDGVTLLVTNGATGTTPALQVGAGLNSDIVFNTPVTNTISGNGGRLLVLGNPFGSGLANQLNFQVRQSANPGIPNAVTLDMSGLGTFVATVGKFTVGQGGTGSGQSNVSACVYLARTNVITLLRAVSGQFALGDSSGATNLPGSTLNLGITNAFYMDTMFVGNRRATNNLIRFNPAFTGITTPVAYIRGSNALGTSRVTSWNIADASTETFTPVNVQANVDFSGGKLDALVNTMIVGRGATTAADTGSAQGTLTLTAGTLDVNNLTDGVQRANNTATEVGTVNVNGTATLISTNITLAQAAAGANASLVTGTLNVTNGIVRANITAGGGISTVNLSGGTLVVSSTAGTPAAPLTALNFADASLHLKADGNATTAPVNAAAVSAAGTTTITIDSVANVTGPTTLHLISYSGSDPYAGLSLASLPIGYAGSLVDNSGSVDLNVTVSAPPPPPSIRNLIINGSQVIVGGTNNSGAGGTYSVLTSTNVSIPLTNWTVLNSGTFDASGNFSSTNATGTNSARFYILRVP